MTASVRSPSPNALFLALTGVLWLLAAPAHPQPTAAPSAAGWQEIPEQAARQAWLERLYGLTESALRESGYSVMIELRDFVHIPRAHFSENRWHDVQTPDHGPVVDIGTFTRREMFDGLLVRQDISYSAQWREPRSWRRGFPHEFEEDSLLSDLLATATALGEPRAAGVQGLTTFQVELEFGGRRRIYQAAALWLPDEGQGSEATFNLVLGDNILNNVEITFVPPAPFDFPAR